MCLLQLGYAKIAVIESFEANFTQTLTAPDTSAKNTVEYKGKIFAKSPNMALWEYTAPIAKSIYIKGQDVIIYEPLLEQATVSSIQESIDLFYLIKNAKEIKSNTYRSSILGQEYDLRVNSDGILQEISFVDNLGNQISIVFSDIKVNEPIDRLKFEFVPKSSVDLLYR